MAYREIINIERAAFLPDGMGGYTEELAAQPPCFADVRQEAGTQVLDDGRQVTVYGYTVEIPYNPENVLQAGDIVKWESKRLKVESVAENTGRTVRKKRIVTAQCTELTS